MGEPVPTQTAADLRQKLLEAVAELWDGTPTIHFPAAVLPTLWPVIEAHLGLVRTQVLQAAAELIECDLGISKYDDAEIGYAGGMRKAASLVRGLAGPQKNTNGS